MAETEEIPTLATFATNSYDTALCVIPPAQQCHDIDQLRSLYDKAYGSWPPHINLIYPFVAPEHLPQATEQIKSQLVKLDPTSRFNVCLDRSGSFAHRVNSTIFLAESKPIINSSLNVLQKVALRAVGQDPTPCNFHLTIGQSEDQTESSRDFLLSKANLVPRLNVQINQLAILIREKTQGREKIASRMRLWGVITLPNPGLADYALSEFWLPSMEKAQFDTEHEDEDEGSDSSEPMIASPFNRSIQPGTTYQYNRATGIWVACATDTVTESIPSTLTVSSYNVLIDSVYPPARDRDPLLLATILTRYALADVLVLQEVSDDFLSYLLADSQVQKIYPFTTHGPPSQPDIGPLPSLRNVVVLSKWYLSWEMVPFHRRHKGAVVAKINSISRSEPSGSFPLVIAGVHLTCGLTDGSVAAKRVQLQNLKNYLTRHYPSNPWIIAGDFNITTSSYTIKLALKNKNISQQTAKTLTSIENMLTEAGIVDAWSTARVEGVDQSSMDFDDLFEGEDGATFNPRENELAAATSGTSHNRPQRYDRILIRPQGMLRIGRFDHFGIPETHDGVQVVPSDHSGIRAAMKIVTEAPGKQLSDGEMLEQYPVQTKRTSESLKEVISLSTALNVRDMFPTEEEVEHRKEAFSIIKEVILGSSNDEDASTSEIPLVMVPVGSYALGVWSTASDIDCLCIGSISSKTFFKLARQRIHRAEAQGVRLLRRVEANTGTMFELSVNGISMDLQYCPAAQVVERWSDLPNIHHSDPIFNLSMLSLRKLKPYRDISYIQRSLPSLSTFRLAYRCIKLWAVQRGIYSSKFGYLGGIHITLMLSWICKRLAHDIGTVTATDVIATFFHHYANFDWKNDMVFDAFFHKKQPRYHRTAREPMVVLGFHAPNANVAHTSTVPGLDTLVKEFKMADQQLSHENTTWDSFLGVPEDVHSGVTEFLKSHDSYAQITIQYWGRSLSKGKGLVGWVESRCLLLVVDINKALPDVEIRIWPARFTDTSASTSQTDYQGSYLIGLSKKSEIEAQLTKDEKSLAKQALHKAFTKFEEQLQSDDKNYDPNTSWVGISLVKPDNVKDLKLDDREWGDYIPDFDADSDDEDELEEGISEDEEFSTTQKLPLRSRPSPSSTPVSSTKLRPASDVLNRLRWDPNLDPNEYIVGYEDRFLGAKETSLERWKTEQTDDEFIPQHRILYFKRRGDGEIVWERKTRIDLVFGSGISSVES